MIDGMGMESLIQKNLRHSVELFLAGIGEDQSRPGLVDTPRRVVAAWGHLFSGYSQDPKSVFTVFDSPSSDGMVVLKDIEFVSFCEHHILPFTGRAAIGYIPDGKVIGISKLARLLDIFTHRLQIQEQIGSQVCEAIMEYLKPIGCGCIIEAVHSCISCRGVMKQHSKMVTSTLTERFREPAIRDEFLRLCGK